MAENTNIPTLTLTPDLDAEMETAPVQEEVELIEPVKAEESLTPEEMAVVDDFAEKIDITNSSTILQYGAASQKKIASFSETALTKVRTKDMGEVGGMITDLVGELHNFDADKESGGIFGFFKKKVDSITLLKRKYDSAEKNVNHIATMLEDHQVVLLKDITMLDELYKVNLAHFKELTMYVVAGKKKLESFRANELQAAIAKAKETNAPEDAQYANDLENMCVRFEKKIHDLELTRIISVQMAPQIRLVQNNDTLMSEKIQSTIVNTIPLWKSQMVIALGVAHSEQALEAQREVTDMTNELLRANAEKLKTATIETAKESERGIVDLETLKHTNAQLIETLDSVTQIQTEGREKRKAAEVELGRIEGELKQKLLEIRN